MGTAEAALQINCSKNLKWWKPRYTAERAADLELEALGLSLSYSTYQLCSFRLLLQLSGFPFPHLKWP